MYNYKCVDDETLAYSYAGNPTKLLINSLDIETKETDKDQRTICRIKIKWEQNICSYVNKRLMFYLGWNNLALVWNNQILVGRPKIGVLT